MNDLNGLLLVNKPSGCTSHDVVAQVRKALKTKAVGHTGTLDPLASGLMVLLIGKATKLSDFLLKGNKRYRVRVRLGVTTDSLDRTGKILDEKDIAHLTEDRILDKIKSLQGHHVLPIPAFSAKKVDGEKLCDLARRGESVPDIEKDMFFYDLDIAEIKKPVFEISFSCSKGSFVRSWVHKLGELLQVGACVEELERTYSEPYSLNDAISLDRLEADTLGAAWVPFNETLPDWPSLVVNAKEQQQVLNGLLPPLLKGRVRTLAQKHEKVRGIRLLTEDHNLLSLLVGSHESDSWDFKIRRVFPQS